MDKVDILEALSLVVHASSNNHEHPILKRAHDEIQTLRSRIEVLESKKLCECPPLEFPENARIPQTSLLFKTVPGG